MATIKDIAARSGVSIATVSKHINGIPVKESNRRRIDEAIRELGYQVNAAARALKQGFSALFLFASALGLRLSGLRGGLLQLFVDVTLGLLQKFLLVLSDHLPQLAAVGNEYGSARHACGKPQNKFLHIAPLGATYAQNGATYAATWCIFRAL